MKIRDLATELRLSGKEVLEKAKSMGISVSKETDELSEMDLTAVRNTLIRSREKDETKVVRASRAKKDDSEKKADEPKRVGVPEERRDGVDLLHVYDAADAAGTENHRTLHLNRKLGLLQGEVSHRIWLLGAQSDRQEQRAYDCNAI